MKIKISKLDSQTVKPKEQQQPLKTEEKKENPRQGKFSSDDVDIKKMFYYGNK